MRLIPVLFVAALPLWGDATYKLAYKVEPNPILRAIAVAAGVSKFDSPGDTIWLKEGRLRVNTAKMGLIANFAKDEFVLLDHDDKTWEKLNSAGMKARMTGDIPSPMLDLLNRFFPRGKGGVEVELKVTAATEEHPTLDAFRQKYGMNYLIPGLDTVIGVAPGLAERFAALPAKETTHSGLDLLIGSGGRMMRGRVEILDYQEAPVPDSVFTIPAGYRDVTSAVAP